MPIRHREAGAASKLVEVPANADQKTANLIAQENFEIIWRTMNDIRARLDTLSK